MMPDTITIDGYEYVKIGPDDVKDPTIIFLAPECCFDRGSHEGRCWCEDNVWPCADCPSPSKAHVPTYTLQGYVGDNFPRRPTSDEGDRT